MYPINELIDKYTPLRAHLTLVGPVLDRHSGTFVDTESEIRAKRLSDCLPIGGSQIDAAFFKRILISKRELQGKEANHFD